MHTKKYIQYQLWHSLKNQGTEFAKLVSTGWVFSVICTMEFCKNLWTAKFLKSNKLWIKFIEVKQTKINHSKKNGGLRNIVKPFGVQITVS